MNPARPLKTTEPRRGTGDARRRHFRCLIATAVLMLTAGVAAPSASAQVLVTYFNFETALDGGPPDLVADVAPANPGGGQQASVITTDYMIGDFRSDEGLLLNRTALDSDTANPGQALMLNRAGSNNGRYIQFSVNTTLLADFSLSFAVDSAGNGFETVALSYSFNGVDFFSNAAQPTQTILNGVTLVTFSNIDSAVDFAGNVIFRLTFTGGISQGQDRQTVIDNMQLNAGTMVPEPSTWLGASLALLAVGFTQRRRIRRLLVRSA